MIPPGNGGFMPISNPYIVGNPIEDRKMFFGREDDFQFIRNQVAQIEDKGGRKGGLIVLCGARRSGKTSILFQAKGGRLGPRFIPVLIDMQAMTVQDDKEFLAKLAGEVIGALDDPGISFHRDYEALVEKRNNPFAAFQSLIKKISPALDGRKLILLFDEYELFEVHIEKKRFSGDILNLLATWMEHEEGIFIVFTGSDRVEQRPHEYWGHFLGKAMHRRISFLSHDDTMRLIKEPVAGQVDYDEDVPEKIYTLTAGQPFYTQVICQSIVDHLNEQDRTRVDAGILNQTVEEIIVNALPQMIFSWTSLSPVEKLTLAMIAKLTESETRPVEAEEILELARRERIGYQIDPNNLKEALERLFHQDLLAKAEGANTYTFKMDLWRRWIERMHSIWQVIDEISDRKDLAEYGLRRISKRKTWLGMPAIALAIIGLVVVSGVAIWLSNMSGAEDPERRAFAVAAPESTMLTLKSEPSGARVFLANKLLGRTPLSGVKVPAGPAQLDLELAGFKSFRETLTLEEGVEFSRDVSLARRLGYLDLVSTPPGALIVQDRVSTGLRTPARLELSPGSKNLSLQMQGYVDKDVAVTVLEDSVQVLSYALERITYPLTVVSNPSGAGIFLDGVDQGKTPRRLERKPGGAYSLELRLAGYVTERIDLELPAPDNLVEVDLRRLPPGTIVVRVSPYAEIWLDGRQVSEVRQFFEIEAEPGPHTVGLVHPISGRVDYEVIVRPQMADTVAHVFRRSGESG